MINFNCTPEERQLAVLISVRAQRAKLTTDVLGTQMDIVATHMNGCPLDLQGLLDAEAFDFSHDICGIARHLDRDDDSPTGGQLLNCFRPRYAKRDADFNAPGASIGSVMAHLGKFPA